MNDCLLCLVNAKSFFVLGACIDSTRMKFSSKRAPTWTACPTQRKEKEGRMRPPAFAATTPRQQRKALHGAAIESRKKSPPILENST
jgi:hypothetical protein